MFFSMCPSPLYCILEANASAFGQKLTFYIIFQEEKDESSKFEISVSDDFSGRWAFKSKTRGYFLGSNADALVCTAKVPNDSELWFVHLAVRPQVNLHSIGRKRFAHLSDVQVRILFIIYYTGCLMAICIFGVKFKGLICKAKVPIFLVCPSGRAASSQFTF